MIFKLAAAWLIIINMIAFIAYGVDKHKARSNKSRPRLCSSSLR